MLDERLIAELVALVTDGPAIGPCCARHAVENVEPRGAAIRRGEYTPGPSVPSLDQRLISATSVIASHSPAVQRRYTCHAIEIVFLPAAGVGRGDYQPAARRTRCDAEHGK